MRGLNLFGQYKWVSATLVLLCCVLIGVAGFVANYRNNQIETRDQLSQPPITFDSAIECSDQNWLKTFSCVITNLHLDQTDLRDQYALEAQQENAAWAFGSMVFSGISVFFAAIGAIALVYTFFEQRKMLQAEKRAYLEIISGEVLLHPTYGLQYVLKVQNNGQTPAQNARLSCTISHLHQRKRDDKKPDDFVKPFEINLAEIPAKSTKIIKSERFGIYNLDGMNFDGGSHLALTGQYGQEDYSPAEQLRVNGNLHYHDVYNEHHIIQIDQYTFSVYRNQTLSGTGRDAPYS